MNWNCFIDTDCRLPMLKLMLEIDEPIKPHCTFGSVSPFRNSFKCTSLPCLFGFHRFTFDNKKTKYYNDIFFWSYSTTNWLTAQMKICSFLIFRQSYNTDSAIKIRLLVSIGIYCELFGSNRKRKLDINNTVTTDEIKNKIK